MTYEKRKEVEAFYKGMKTAEKNLTLFAICQSENIDWIEGG